MQTFLPYPDFAESLASLDQARLGKQRVETLQLLRSALLPSYGWQNHPVSVMWRGFLPGLTAYGLVSVDEWIRRGHADTTASLIREFAPEVEGLSQEELARRGLLPPWLGEEALHRSHRSNLIRKDPSFYAEHFPGTPPDLDYWWPGEPEGGAPRRELHGRPVRVVRATTADEAEAWRDAGLVAVGERSPRGRDTPAWRAQVTEFVDALEEGSEVGVLVGNAATLARARVTGPLGAMVSGSDAFLTRPVEYVGEWERGDFEVPAMLQDPRSVFSATVVGFSPPASGGTGRLS